MGQKGSTLIFKPTFFRDWHAHPQSKSFEDPEDFFHGNLPIMTVQPTWLLFRTLISKPTSVGARRRLPVCLPSRTVSSAILASIVSTHFTDFNFPFRQNADHHYTNILEWVDFAVVNKQVIKQHHGTRPPFIASCTKTTSKPLSRQYLDSAWRRTSEHPDKHQWSRYQGYLLLATFVTGEHVHQRVLEVGIILTKVFSKIFTVSVLEGFQI